jgi:hypothetical protein
MELGRLARSPGPFLDLEPKRAVLLGWATQEKLTESATSTELGWWMAPVATLEDDERHAARCARYTRAPLAWALGRMPQLPPFGDLVALGKRVGDLDLDELDTFMDITEQRLGALNWLCGHGADWDKVLVDPL